jgi:predicted NACHT family NTPase
MTVHDVFEEAGGGLLILGAPGSGKTTALLELARDLLDRAELDSTEPIPIVFNLTSWADRRSDLEVWLADELVDSYQVPRGTGQSWVVNGQVLPLLDGLDEVAETYREKCVAAINAFRIEYGLVRLAICSRTQEYEALATKLRLEEAVELQPPTWEQVNAYLDHLEGIGTSIADVRVALDHDEALQELPRRM